MTNVYIFGIGCGTLINTRFDSLGRAIYTIETFEPNATTDGIFYARGCEVLFY